MAVCGLGVKQTLGFAMVLLDHIHFTPEMLAHEFGIRVPGVDQKIQDVASILDWDSRLCFKKPRLWFLLAPKTRALDMSEKLVP